VAINPAAFTAATGVGNVLGPFTNRLSNGGGTLRIRNNNGRLIDEVSYGTEGDWPVAPDGAGPSLAKIDEDSGSANPANWRASLQIGGNPGVINIPLATSTTISRTLVPLNKVWKYNQSGVDLGTEWKEPVYDDSAWPSGAGVLGLEDNATVRALTNTALSLTNSSGQRVITYYFRTHFTFTNNPGDYFLTANNLLDDGVVVYLNGSEVSRYRVPEGQNFQTLAMNQASEGAFETITFPSTALVQGDNVLAAEVHQVNTGSSDVAFGVELKDGRTITNAPPDGSSTNLAVAFNEISSVTNAQFWIELVNLSAESVTLDNCVLARFGNPTNREYVIPSGTIPPGGYFVLDRATLGFGADPGDRVILYAPGKTAVLDAAVAKSSAPVIVDPEYHYAGHNVSSSDHKRTSFLNWLRRMVKVQRADPVFRGTQMRVLALENTHVLAFVREGEGGTVLCVTNLSRFAQPAIVPLSDWRGCTPVDLIGGARFPVIDAPTYLLTLGPHTMLWLRLEDC
jgi:hypothetical protein